MGCEGFVVRDDVSAAGLRRLHVVQAGRRVDREGWMERYGITLTPDPSPCQGEGGLVAVLEYEEEGTGMWHLRLYWRPEGSSQ